MLSYLNISILESEAQTIVNTVNTDGVMGKGLAAAFKKKYPDMFDKYKTLCKSGNFNIGQLWLWKSSKQWVLNFPTKQHWRNPSKISYIEAGLAKFVEQYQQRGIYEIAFPRLGCGNGGLDWKKVKPIMEKYLAPLPITVYIHDYEYDIGNPEHKNNYVKKFNYSFANFIKDLYNILTKEHIYLSSYKKIKFHVSFSTSMDLLIESHLRTTKLTQEELYGIWILLLNGPLTDKSIVGPAKDDAECLLTVISNLPYTRTLKIRKMNEDSPSIAIELLNKKFSSKIISAG